MEELDGQILQKKGLIDIYLLKPREITVWAEGERALQ